MSRPTCRLASSETREYHRAKDRDRRVEQSGGRPTHHAPAGRHGQDRIAMDVIGHPLAQVECPSVSTAPGLLFSRLRPSSTGRVQHRAVSTPRRHRTRLETGLDSCSRPARSRGPGRAVPPPKIGILPVVVSVCAYKKWSLLSRIRDQHPDCARRIIPRTGECCLADAIEQERPVKKAVWFRDPVFHPRVSRAHGVGVGLAQKWDRWMTS